MYDRLLIIGIAALSLSIGVNVIVVRSAFETRAYLIQRGLAEYCATDGRFVVTGECQ